jgi:hypothetical protein
MKTPGDSLMGGCLEASHLVILVRADTPSLGLKGVVGPIVTCTSMGVNLTFIDPGSGLATEFSSIL